MERLRVAAIQMCSGRNREANLAEARRHMEQAVQQGAQLVALPENFSFLDREGEKVHKVEDLEQGPAVQLLRRFARENGIIVVGGTVPLRKGDKVTNTCLVFGADGSLIARYDKIHLFDIALDDAHSFTESRYIAPGRRLASFDAFGQTMGLSVCYDLRFPELYRHLALDGATVLFVPSAFTWRTGSYHWEVLLRARAIENLCYMVAPAQQGKHNARRESYGHTLIVDPWGQVLAQAPVRRGVVMAELDFSYQALLRRQLPCLQHVRMLERPERRVKT